MECYEGSAFLFGIFVGAIGVVLILLFMGSTGVDPDKWA